jgi:predicted DNA-binding transcriptional regulator AlpA
VRATSILPIVHENLSRRIDETTLEKTVADLTAPLTDEPLMIAPEVATLTRIPINTLYHHRAIGTGIPSAKIGKRIVYRKSDVLDYIAAAFAESALAVSA